MDVYLRARVNDLTDAAAERLVASGVRLSVNALWASEKHVAQVAAHSPVCGVELYPIRAWLKATGRDDRDYPDPANLTPVNIRDIVEQGVMATGQLLADAGLDPRLIYVMSEPGWKPNAGGGPLAAVVDLYGRLETAIACTWPQAMQAWYIAGWHHTRPDQRHPEWPATLAPAFAAESSTLYRLPEVWRTIAQASRPVQLAWVGLHCWYDAAGQWHTGKSEQLEAQTYEGIGALLGMMREPPEAAFLYSEDAPLDRIVEDAVALMRGQVSPIAAKGD